MAKTKETLLLEQALHRQSAKNREYGCEEITIGFMSNGHGDEVVDYMSMDSKRIFRCYEIKVTLQDLKTDNKKSFYGDYNYLVVSNSLYLKNPVWENYIPPYVGILVGEDLIVKKQAKKKVVQDDIRLMLEDSLLRSVYWKYTKYKEASSFEEFQILQKKIQEKEDEIVRLQNENEMTKFTYRDYEFYYGKNHQKEFSLINGAKEERRQFQLRQKQHMTWIQNDDIFVCPECQNHERVQTPYCPQCGADLRKL